MTYSASFADNNDGIWVGTLWQGICYYNPSMYKFKLIQTVQNKTMITNESVRCLLKTKTERYSLVLLHTD